MNWWEQVRALVCSLAGMDFVDETSAQGNDWLRTAPAQPPARAGKMRARRMWPFGIRARPPQGVEATWVSPMGAATSRIYVAAESNAYGPTDLKEGEVCIYNSQDSQSEVCRIKLDSDGNVVIIPKSSAKVKLGSGTDASLDSVALFTQLQSDFNDFVSTYNNHDHLAGTLAAGATAVTGATGRPVQTASDLSAAVASSNVVAKKP